MQEIDHIFVTKNVYEKMKASGAVELHKELDYKTHTNWNMFCFIPHINSMFTRNNHVNLSDHDPDIIRIPNAFAD